MRLSNRTATCQTLQFLATRAESEKPRTKDPMLPSFVRDSATEHYGSSRRARPDREMRETLALSMRKSSRRFATRTILRISSSSSTHILFNTCLLVTDQDLYKTAEKTKLQIVHQQKSIGKLNLRVFSLSTTRESHKQETADHQEKKLNDLRECVLVILRV